MNLRRLFSSWQGWAAGVIAIAVYFSFPAIGRFIDPTSPGFAPAFGIALVQLLATAAVFYFSLVAMAWAGWQIAFKSLDRLYDGEIASLYRKLPPWFSVLMIQLSFVFMTLCWMWALNVAFRILS